MSINSFCECFEEGLFVLVMGFVISSILSFPAIRLFCQDWWLTLTLKQAFAFYLGLSGLTAFILIFVMERRSQHQKTLESQAFKGFQV